MKIGNLFDSFAFIISDKSNPRKKNGFKELSTLAYQLYEEKSLIKVT
jgi:hypothetical protein